MMILPKHFLYSLVCVITLNTFLSQNERVFSLELRRSAPRLQRKAYSLVRRISGNGKKSFNIIKEIFGTKLYEHYPKIVDHTRYYGNT